MIEIYIPKFFTSSLNFILGELNVSGNRKIFPNKRVGIKFS